MSRLRHIVTRVLKGAAISVACLVALLLGTAGVLISWPQIALNQRSLSWAADYLRKHEIVDLRWRKVNLLFERETFLRKRVMAHFDDLCVVKADLLKACFVSFEAEARVGFSGFKPALLSVGPLAAQGGRFEVYPASISGTLQAQGVRVPGLSLFRVNYQVDGRWSQYSRHARAEVQGEAGFSEVTAEISGVAQGILPDHQALSVTNCQVSVFRAKGGGLTQIHCPVWAGIPSGKYPDLPVPRRLGAVLKAELHSSSFPPAPKEKIIGKISAELSPIHESYWDASGGASAEVDGLPMEFPGHGKLDLDAGIQVRVSDFAKAVRALEPTKFAVWAPLRSLSGSIRLEARGKMDPQEGTIPVSLTTRLSSKKQKLNIDAQGQVTVAHPLSQPQAHAKADVVLSEVTLELPKLDLAQPPRLVRDSRIHSLKQVAQEAGTVPTLSAFDYEIVMTTPEGRPVQVLTNLAQAPVPVALDFHLKSGAPISGTVAVRQFPVKFFSREATVDHFRLALASTERGSPIDGELKMDLTDYEIRVLATGTMEKPGFVLLSDPPLSQDQILALLLYGQSPDELDEDQSSSIGNAQAAMRDHAIGLASFLLLGSTPIQAIGYDSVTQQVQMRFRLAEGTSLTVAAGEGAVQGVGVRKRLGKHWSIATDVNTAPGEDRVVSAFLEWAGRY